MRARVVLCSIAVAVLSLLAVWPVTADSQSLAPRGRLIPRLSRPAHSSLLGSHHPGSPQGDKLLAPPDTVLPQSAQACDGLAASLHLSSNQFYFHMAGPEVPDALTVDGWVEGHFPAYRLGLKLPPSEDDFDLERTEGPELPQPAPAIPISWELRYCDGEDWTAWLAPEVEGGPGLSQRSFWWVLAGDSCVYDFRLRCAIQPKPFPFQPAGHYERQVRIEVRPWKPGGK